MNDSIVNFNKEKTIFGVLHILIFGLSIGLVAWIAKISPSLLSDFSYEEIKTAEDGIGIKYNYSSLEVGSFVFFGLLIILSFIGIIMNFVSKEKGSKINIGRTTLGLGIILTLFSIPLIVMGGLALEDNKKVDGFQNTAGAIESVFLDWFKNYVDYNELGTANLVGGIFTILIGLLMIFWYFYKMRNKNIEPKEEDLSELEPISMRPQNRNL